MKRYVLLLASLAISTSAFANCEDLKTTLAAKLDARHVAGYTLEVVPTGQGGDAKVIGTCEGGTKKIIYTKK